MIILGYAIIILPVLAIVFQLLIDGHYKVAHDFVYQDTSFLDEMPPEDGVNRSAVIIPVPNDPYDSVLHAWLFTPETRNVSEKIPIVIMSHGIGGQKDMGLTRYGKEFVKAGYASLMFDYRHFGGSYSKKKAPYRNYINPWMHFSDIQTVLQFVQAGNLDEVGIDQDRIALWGSSFAGGHVLAATSTLPSIHPTVSSLSGTSGLRAVISQIPHLNGKLATKQAIAVRGVLGTLRVIAVAAADYFYSLFGPAYFAIFHSDGKHQYSPLYVPIAGITGSTAYMTMSEEGLISYYSKHPDVYLGGWRNLAPARTMAVISLYNPENYLDSYPSDIPLLFVTASRDSICPPSLVEDAVLRHKKRLQKTEMVTVNCDHFDIYYGEPFEHSFAAMRNFLQKHL
jgi:fermentation-respiration switch protein FrsA (DUF1100 family)